MARDNAMVSVWLSATIYLKLVDAVACVANESLNSAARSLRQRRNKRQLFQQTGCRRRERDMRHAIVLGSKSCGIDNLILYWVCAAVSFSFYSVEPDSASEKPFPDRFSLSLAPTRRSFISGSLRLISFLRWKLASLFTANHLPPRYLLTDTGRQARGKKRYFVI